MITTTPKETIKLGEKLAEKLKQGDIVVLHGDLGSGKTTFTKGIGKGLGVKKHTRINSPTFVLIKEYEGRIPLYHIDLYRLDDIDEIENIGIEHYMFGEGVTIIEWGDKIKSLLPKNHIQIKIVSLGGNKRKIEIKEA